MRPAHTLRPDADVVGTSPVLASHGLDSGRAALLSEGRKATELSAASFTPEDGGFHTPQPEHYFIGTGQSWATVSGARLRLQLEGRADQHSGNGKEAADGSNAPVTVGSSSTSLTGELVETPAQASNAHRSPPSVGTATNGVNAGPWSFKGVQAKLKKEHQELSRAVLAEQVAEAEAQAQLDAELGLLKQRSNEEANSINNLLHHIGEAGQLLRDELHDMDEGKLWLQAELQKEEEHRQVCEAQLHNEEEELCSRVQAQEQQLSEMALSRNCMETHLKRMSTMQAWLRGDIEDARRTRTAVEAVGKGASELRSEEAERVSLELHQSLQEQRSVHDTWRARAESEIFRLRQESKRQRSEEHEISEHLSQAREDYSEARSKLRESVESTSEEDEALTQQILQLRQECRHQADVDLPAYVAEENTIVAECQEEERSINACHAEIEAVVAAISQAQFHAMELSNWQAEEAATATMTAADRQDANWLKSELRTLNDEIQEAQRREVVLHQDMENAQRGFLGFCKRRARHEPDLEAPPQRPPLPPPAGAPGLFIPERGPLAHREPP